MDRTARPTAASLRRGMCSVTTAITLSDRSVQVGPLVVVELAPGVGLVEQLLQLHVRHRRDELEQRSQPGAERAGDRGVLLGAAEPGHQQRVPGREAGAPRARTGQAGRSCRPPRCSRRRTGRGRHPGIARSASAPWSAPQKNSPNCDDRPDLVRRNSKSVTTPKLPPPPRIAQNRSGFSSAVARRIWPSAVTISAETQVVDGEAALAAQPAHTTAQGEPADAGVTHQAGRHGQPVRLRGRIHVAQQAPPPTRTRLATGSTVTSFSRLRSIIETVVRDARARGAVRATADGDLQPVLGAEPDCRGDVGGARALRDHAPAGGRCRRSRPCARCRTGRRWVQARDPSSPLAGHRAAPLIFDVTVARAGPVVS